MCAPFVQQLTTLVPLVATQTFADLASLEWLDLSANFITHLQDDTFVGASLCVSVCVSLTLSLPPPVAVVNPPLIRYAIRSFKTSIPYARIDTKILDTTEPLVH